MTHPSDDDRIDSTFRNGTLTGIGLVVAFSLGFLTRWAGVPGKWVASDVVALVLIVGGIVLQMHSLYRFLDVDSLLARNHRRYVKVFKVGMSLTALGIVVAICAELLGFGGTVIRE
ncbi:hypothetical protein [Alsobacter sp. R-9]